MSAGRDDKAKTKQRKMQREKALVKRKEIKEKQLERRCAKRAKRKLLKLKDARK